MKDKDFKLAILSDAPKLEAYLRLCSVGFDDFFDVILTKDDIGKAKPHAKGFLMAAKKLGVDIKDCIMIGDRPERDIIGAKKLGMKAVFAQYGNTTGDSPAMADYMLRDITELIDLERK